MKDAGLVRIDAVVAVLPRAALPEHNLGPAVIVEYVAGNRYFAIANECKNEAEQEVLLRDYKATLGII